MPVARCAVSNTCGTQVRGLFGLAVACQVRCGRREPTWCLRIIALLGGRSAEGAVDLLGMTLLRVT